MTEREALIDALRFGPMALMMRDWTEAMRISLCEQMASDLMSSGWTRGIVTTQPRDHHSGVWTIHADTGECGCECARCYVDDMCVCPDCTYDHDHSRRDSHPADSPSGT